MQNRSDEHHSFIVRIWREEGDLWRGWVQHASTQEETYVQSLPDLLAFIQARTGKLGSQPETLGRWQRHKP